MFNSIAGLMWGTFSTLWRDKKTHVLKCLDFGIFHIFDYFEMFVQMNLKKILKRGRVINGVYGDLFLTLWLDKCGRNVQLYCGTNVGNIFNFVTWQMCGHFQLCLDKCEGNFQIWMFRFRNLSYLWLLWNVCTNES
jgi:hypothetical protein